MEDGGFTVVTHLKKRGRVKQNKSTTRSNHEGTTGALRNDVNKSVVVNAVLRCRNEIERDEFMSDIKELVSRIQEHLEGEPGARMSTEEPTERTKHNDCENLPSGMTQVLCKESKKLAGELVCYGLGNFSECHIARYQMALLLILRDRLKVDVARCSLYDPVLSEDEKAIAQELNVRVLSLNEVGKRCVTDSAIFYMPHCGKPLYNNLLWANWSPSNLQRLVVIGNSFSKINERTPRRLMEAEAGFILKALPYLTEFPLPNNFTFKDVFNDSSTHLFKVETLKLVPTELWRDCTEPEYANDVEVITTS